MLVPIDRHEFNSSWTGMNVGIIRSAKFFDDENTNKQSLLEQFDWVEFKCGAAKRGASWKFRKEGFFLSDTQLKLHLNLRELTSNQDDNIRIVPIDRSKHRIDADRIMPFSSERFNQLGFLKAEDISKRYAIWGNDLILRDPEFCLLIEKDGTAQGWFLSEFKDGILDLSLAMLDRDAVIRGFDLYQNSLLWYKNKGVQRASGWFSSSNLPVLNIFSRLGATFSVAQDIWIWEKGVTHERRRG